MTLPAAVSPGGNDRQVGAADGGASANYHNSKYEGSTKHQDYEESLQ